MTAELADLITANPDSVRAAIAIIDAHDTLAARMTQQLCRLVEDRARSTALGSVRAIDGEFPLFSRNNFGMLRLDVGDDRFDFALEAGSTYFRDLAAGLCVRRETRGLARAYALEIAKLRKALGPGDGDVPDAWWLWWEHAASIDTGGRRTADRASLWAWAADSSDDGLAACFVRRAVEAKSALQI